MKRPAPPPLRCPVHGEMLVDVAVPSLQGVPGKPYRAPKLKQACRVCEPDLVLLDVVSGLWGRPGDWPKGAA